MKHPLAALGATGATNVTITAFTLLNGVVMARLLGPSGRGAVFVIVALPTAVAALVGSFVHPVLARRAAARGDGEGRLNALCLRATLPLAALTAALSVAVLLLAGQLTTAERRAAVAYAVAWAPCSLAVLGFQACDIGRARWRRYNLLRLLPYPVILAGLVACALGGRRSPAAVLAVLVASTAVPLLVRMAIAAREGGFERAPAGEVRALFRGGAPFLAAGGAAAALSYADQVVAALVLPTAEAGLYAVAQRAGLLLGPLATAAGVVGFSEAAQDAAAVEAPRAWTRAVPALLVACGIVLAPAVWYAVPLLYGREFAAARGAAAAAVGGGVLAALAEVREQRLEGGGRPLRAVPGRIAGAVAAAVAAAPAGARWGAPGIVAGTVVGQGIRTVVLARVSARAPVRA